MILPIEGHGIFKETNILVGCPYNPLLYFIFVPIIVNFLFPYAI
jgi:hypothetical protein